MLLWNSEVFLELLIHSKSFVLKYSYFIEFLEKMSHFNVNCKRQERNTFLLIC